MVEGHVSDSIAAYSLGILAEEEALQVATHLNTCEACRQELQDYQLIADQLGLAARQSTPPTSLKTRILDSIKTTQQAKNITPARTWWQRLANFLGHPSLAWGLTSLVLLVALAANNLLLGQRVQKLENFLPAGFIYVKLEGTENAPQARGVLVMSQDGDHGTLIVEGLPRLEQDKQYQLWLIQENQRTSGGVFSVNLDGYAALWVHDGKPLSVFDSFGITIEPSGGSPGPTGKKVLGGKT